MPTITDKDVVQEIVSGNGLYPGDESSPLGPVVRIVSYTNNADERVWGILYLKEMLQGLWDKYMVTSEYLRSPVDYWIHPDVRVQGISGDQIVTWIE